MSGKFVCGIHLYGKLTRLDDYVNTAGIFYIYKEWQNLLLGGGVYFGSLYSHIFINETYVILAQGFGDARGVFKKIFKPMLPLVYPWVS